MPDAAAVSAQLHQAAEPPVSLAPSPTTNVAQPQQSLAGSDQVHEPGSHVRAATATVTATTTATVTATATAHHPRHDHEHEYQPQQTVPSNIADPSTLSPAHLVLSPLSNRRTSLRIRSTMQIEVSPPAYSSIYLSTCRYVRAWLVVLFIRVVHACSPNIGPDLATRER